MTTWDKNCTKEYRLHKEGKSVNQDLKEVWQYTMEGTFVSNYISQNEAARQVPEVTQQTISLCCRGEIASSGNYRWFFEEQFDLNPITEHTYYNTVHEYCPITKSLLNTYSSLEDITIDKNEQTFIRRAIREKKLFKERLFSLTFLSKIELLEIISNTKGISAITVYDLNYNLISVYKSANKASKILKISDTTIKRYAKSRQPYNNYLFRLKFDDEIAEQKHLKELNNV